MDLLSAASESYEFDLCRSEVERYLHDLDEWVECKTREAKQTANDAEDRAKQVINRFNCRARRESVCF